MLQGQEMLRIGLTGGIGSGKSTVLQMLAGLGAAVIDADAISVPGEGGPTCLTRPLERH